MANGSIPKPISLLPREHGAYAQLGISLLAALALVPFSGRAWAQALATGLVFLISEPLLVMLGRRGEVAWRQASRSARRYLIRAVALLFLALGMAWAGAAMPQMLSILPGMILGLVLLALFLARREHTMVGELLAAWAFSFAALPVAILGKLEPTKALTLALGLGLLNGLGTTMVRGFLASLKPPASQWPRALPLLLGLGMTGTVLATALPWRLALAPLPLTIAALWVLLAPPAPRDLRKLGWVLTAGSALGAVILVTVLY